MYGHPEFTPNQRRIYRGWNQQQKRYRRYWRMVQPVAHVLTMNMGELVALILAALFL